MVPSTIGSRYEWMLMNHHLAGQVGDRRRSSCTVVPRLAKPSIGVIRGPAYDIPPVTRASLRIQEIGRLHISAYSWACLQHIGHAGAANVAWDGQEDLRYGGAFTSQKPDADESTILTRGDRLCVQKRAGCSSGSHYALRGVMVRICRVQNYMAAGHPGIFSTWA